MSLRHIVERELRVATRRPSTYHLRFWVTLVAFIAGAMLTFAYLISAGFPPGQMLLKIMGFYCYALAGLAGAFLSATTLSEEKKEGTLGLLFLTDLRPADIVLGKLAAQILGAAYPLIAVFPVMSLSLLLGGVTAGEFWRVLIALINTLFYALAAGLLLSASSQGPAQAIRRTLVLLAIALIGGPLSSVATPAISWIGIGTPGTSFFSANASSYQADPGIYWRSLLISHMVAWGFLVLATNRLKRWNESIGPADRPEVPAKPFSRRTKRPGALLREAPMTWLVLQQSSVSTLLWSWVACSALFFLAAPALGTPWHYRAVPLLFFVPKILMALQSVRFFAEARRSGAIELLLCTPLTDRELIDGHWKALQRIFFWPTLSLILLASVSVPLYVASSTSPGWISGLGSLTILYSAIKLIVDLMAVGGMGTALAISCRNPGTATLVTIALVLIAPSLLFCVPDLILDACFLFYVRSTARHDLRRIVRRQIEQPLFVPVAAPPILKPE